jgi:hypothetical protein
MSPTVQWTSSEATTRPTWTSLADFVNPTEPKPAAGEGAVESVDLRVETETPESVAFTLQYHLRGKESAMVEEQYDVSPGAVDGAWRVEAANVRQLRVLFPALVNDGAHDLQVNTQQGALEEHRDGGVLRFEVVSPTNVLLHKEGPSVPCHNGFMRAVVGEITRLKSALVWRITLANERQ